MQIDPLLVDIYAGDGNFNVEKLAASGAPWHGVMVKATQGNYYSGNSWLFNMWPRIKAAGEDRYGVDWFRQAYHYLDIRIDGAEQADYFCSVMADVGGPTDVGGFSHGDLWPVVDVERGGQRGFMSMSQVEDVTQRFVERLQYNLKCGVILYGGSFLRDLGITSKMGCAALWLARYTSTLPTAAYTSLGWDLPHVFAWQGVGVNGDGSVEQGWSANGYPVTTPAGHADISAVIVDGGGDRALAWMRKSTIL